jgi:methylmalonyl-CoA mutase, N-terminal domain
VTDAADPLGGSFMVESLTHEILERARAYLAEVDQRGGAVEAIGYMQDEIEDAAYTEQKAIEAKQRVVVGVNEYIETEEPMPELLRVDESAQREQVERLAKLRATRDGEAVTAALADVRDAAKGDDNLLVPMKAALKQMATIGEICNTLREVFGIYRPNR